MLAQLLPQFRQDMQQDSTVQAGAAKRTITAAAKRAGQFVDRTLQLSNLRTLSAYLLGSGTPPAAEKFETEVSHLERHHLPGADTDCCGAVLSARAGAPQMVYAMATGQPSTVTLLTHEGDSLSRLLWTCLPWLAYITGTCLA